MKVIGHLLLSAMTVGDKRRNIELYALGIGSYNHARGSKAYYRAVEIEAECKKVSHEIMNIESHSTMYPIKIDGKTASNKTEVYRLIAERYGVEYKLNGDCYE